MPGPVRFVSRPIRTVVFLDRKSKRRQKKLRLACSGATGETSIFKLFVYTTLEVHDSVVCLEGGLQRLVAALIRAHL